MARINIPFVGQAYDMPTKQLDAQTCVNWFVAYDKTGKFPSALLARPGLDVWDDNSSKKSVRGMFEINDVLYGVIDNTFYTFSSNGNKVSRGTLNTSSGNVRMIANNSQIFITDGLNGYVYQLIKSDTHDANEFFQVEEASSSIGEARFTGSGIDDMTSGGIFTGSNNKNYRVEIDSAGSGSTLDTFRWSDDEGDTWNASNVTITGSDQTLNDGVQATFIHTSGHTLKDRWDFQVDTDSAFYVPIIPACQDGYGVYAKQVSKRWYLSATDDFSHVNALDFALAASFPDNLVAVISVREELWFICRTTTEVWYNTGAAGFPFERRSNLLIRYGCCAPYSVATGGNNTVFWLASSQEGTVDVAMLSGYDVKIISTEALSVEFGSYDVVDDAIGFVHDWEGHLFYTITFPSEDKTWVFDVTTQTWHRRTSTINNDLPSDNQTRQARWLPNNYVYFAGKHLVGDFQTGNIYELNKDSYTDNGEYILCERITQHQHKTLSRLFVNSLQIDFEVGVGLTSGQGSDPQAMLQVSKDGGHTWSKELWRSIGKIGKYQHRVKWNRLGTGRVLTFRLRMTDPVCKTVLGAIADVEAASS